MKEFDLIERYFKNRGHQRRDVLLGVGDDCAVVTVPENQNLATTTDTLVAGVHFLEHAPARSVAYKAVAVNLSDLAAMGAEPAWMSLSLTLPATDPAWMDEFCTGFYELMEYYSVQLIGGDTVQGPLSLTLTAQGFIPHNSALQRSGANPGDWLYVTGSLGDAGAGLALLKQALPQYSDNQQTLINRHLYPTPRVMAGTSLRRIASACIDISDGLVSDLQHIMTASGVGAAVHLDKLPLSQSLVEEMDTLQALQLALNAGDDYELLFTVSEEQKGHLETVLANSNVSANCIGQITGQSRKLEIKMDNAPANLRELGINLTGYEHFNDA